MNNKKVFSIAIDGPCGAGKSSVSDDVARKLDIMHLDSGAMYRAVGLYMLRNGVDVKDLSSVEARMDEVQIDVAYENGDQKTYLMGEDVSSVIRTQEVGDAASAVSKGAYVRRKMVERQQALSEGVSLLVDGRDAGTCILPEATLKIFLTADVRERAKRRYDERIRKGETCDYEEVLKECIERDHNDMTRAVSPLIQAEDAVVVDSTSMTQAEVVDRIIALLKERLEA
ncbi:MAG: (d)CMP kinase [Clostridia bacterium]|nr:(d)CMP kinase [Clostridia bacterium]MBQ2433109.1 (d)CMP kinase [Clostridia bacterium]MBQ5771498.1 (d)CMP kinase [Clostridia bacterium]